MSRRLSGGVIIYINLTACAAAYDLQHSCSRRQQILAGDNQSTLAGHNPAIYSATILTGDDQAILASDNQSTYSIPGTPVGSSPDAQHK